jgi:Raf kinase inhibitor-like YbhB/YbcL family protein
MKLLSSAFSEGGTIPQRYTCDGENLSPALEWRDVPPNSSSLALIVEDPDAPVGVFVHWVLFGMPPQTAGLPEGAGQESARPAGGLQGTNGFRKVAYGGPCPPGGTHRYFFRVYALDINIDLPAGSSRSQLDGAMRGHILAEAQLMGTYTRKRR